MDERFTYLVEKFFDNSLEERERVEFENYLLNPVCSDYLEKAKKAERIIEKGYWRLLGKEYKKEFPDADPEVFSEEIMEDIFKYRNKVSDETKEKVRAMHREMLRQNKRNRLLIYGSVAAAAIVVIGMFLIFAPGAKKKTGELYALYYKPQVFESFRSSENAIDRYRKAIIAYNLSDYTTGAAICRELISTGSGVPGYRFLYGLCYMGMDSMENALQQFKEVKEHPDYIDKGLLIPVHWYASLCYLSMGKADSALNELDKLEGMENGLLKEYRVKELKEDLKKLSR